MKKLNVYDVCDKIRAYVITGYQIDNICEFWDPVVFVLTVGGAIERLRGVKEPVGA